jgi:hypothetical protein
VAGLDRIEPRINILWFDTSPGGYIRAALCDALDQRLTGFAVNYLPATTIRH